MLRGSSKLIPQTRNFSTKTRNLQAVTQHRAKMSVKMPVRTAFDPKDMEFRHLGKPSFAVSQSEEASHV